MEEERRRRRRRRIIDEEEQIPDADVITCCIVTACFASVIIIAVPLALYNTRGPNLVYVQDVYIPALDTSRPGNGTTSIFVDLKYQKDLPPFSYPNEESDLLVLYGHGITAVGGSRVAAFGMGRHTKVHKMVVVEAPELPWEEAIRGVSAGLMVELEIQLRKVRDGGELTRHVAVDASGHMFPRGPVELY